MAKKPIIRYFDRGVWYDATVSDIGNLEDLNTVHKTTVVEAINDIIGGNINISGELLEKLTALDNNISRIDGLIASGSLNETQANQMNQFVTNKLNELNQSIEQLIALRDVRISEQEQAIATLKTNSEESIRVINETKDLLNTTKDKLSAVELNVTTVNATIDEINGQIVQMVTRTDFDLLEGTVREQGTKITETAEGIKLLATKEELDLTNQNVNSVKSTLDVQAGLIESKVSSDQLINEIEKIDKYMPNLLRYTRDWKTWTNDNEINITVTLDEHRNCNIQKIKSAGFGLSTTVEDLQIGETYSLSVWARHEDANAKLYAVVNNNEIIMTNLNSTETFLGNEFKRMRCSFVASSNTETIKFIFKDCSTTSYGYLAGAKCEKSKNVSGWQPHSEDVYQSIKHNETAITQTDGKITNLVKTVEQQGELITTNSTKLTETNNTINLQAESIKTLGESIEANKAELKVQADKISSKVSRTDVGEMISDINIDNKNRVLNSDFGDGWELWSETNNLFQLKQIGNYKFAVAERSGLSQNMAIAIATNKFPVKHNERLMFGFYFYCADLSKLDNKIVCALELLDINDIRIDRVDFDVSKLSLENGSFTKLTNTYFVEDERIVKARLRFFLNRNGNVGFALPMAQGGDIKSSDWSLAPEDVARRFNDTNVTISNYEQTVDGFRQTVESYKGSVDGYSSQVSEFNQTVNGFSQTIKDYKESNDKRVQQLETSLTTESGKIEAVVKESAGTKDELGKLTADGGRISQLELTAQGLKSTVASQTSSIQTIQTVSKTYATKVDTIKSSVEEFYQSNSPTALSGGSWSTTQPTWVQGKYIWRRTKNTYGDDSIAYTPSANGVCITGNTGSNGQNGKGVSSYSITYQVGKSGTTAPTGTWTTTIPSVPQGQYLWTKMVITYTDNTSSTSYSVSYIPVNGQAGATGPVGNGVSSITTEFYLSTSKSTQTGGSWSTTQPTWSPGKYVWTRNKITYTNGSTAYTSPQCSSEWEAVNNVESGGTNYMYGKYIGNNGISNYTFSDKTGEGSGTITNSTPSARKGIVFNRNDIPIYAGESMYIGLTVKTNVNCTYSFDVNNKRLDGQGTGNDLDDTSKRTRKGGTLTANTWQRVYVIFTAGDNPIRNDGSNLAVYTSNPSDTINIEFKEITMKKSNIPVSYSRPAELIDENTQKAQDTADKAKQDVAALTQTVSSQSTRIDQTSSRIEQVASGVTEVGNKLDNLQVGGENLFIDAAFRNKILKADTVDNDNKVPGAWVAYNNNSSYKFVEYNDQINYFQLTSLSVGNLGMAQYYNTDTLQKGKEYCVRVFTMCEDADYHIAINLIKKNSSGSFNWRYKNLLTDIVKASVGFTERKAKFTIPADDDGIMYGISIFNPGSDSSKGHTIKFIKPKLEEGNTFTDFSLSTKDMATQNDLTNNYYQKTTVDSKLSTAVSGITAQYTQDITTRLGNYYDKSTIDSKLTIDGQGIGTYVKNTQSKLDSLQVGGRNLAQGTSNEYSSKYSSFNGTANTCPYLAKVLTDGLSVGDTVTVRLLYKYTDIVATSGQTAKCWIQGSGNSTSWSSGAFYISPVKTLAGSGEFEFLYSFKITAEHLKNTHWDTNIRHDYVKNGSVQWKMFKVEKGNKATDWSPAPEDTNNKIDGVSGNLDDLDKKIGNIDTWKTEVAESFIEQTANSLSALIKDKNGSSLMSFDSTSATWSFNTSVLEDNISDAKDAGDKAQKTANEANSLAKDLKNLLNDIQNKTAYITMTTYNGQPCIELGKTDNKFKVRITNTSVDFLDGSSRVAYVSNNQLYIDKAVVKNEFQIGEGTGFVWKKRSNGNMGLRWGW